MATDTSAETRKLGDKLDALVNIVTQLATNQKPVSVAKLAANQKPASVARVCDIRSSNDHHTSVVLLHSNLTFMLQTPIADHHSNIDKALDREDGV
ncbi:hypothetical protein Fmac_021010 [Flemingia macrophylla]|uniref:Uncharacterized protein n=1 Tax=Flemingia macrophylla TaxID=520843 RepID=A0ABD1LVM4_9FABA